MLKSLAARGKILLCVICGMIVLYVSIPALLRGTLPFQVFNLDAESVTAIEIYHHAQGTVDQGIRIENADEIRELVEQLNDSRYFFWLLWTPSDQHDYVLKIEQNSTQDYYEVSANSVSAGISLFSDMQFILDLLSV